MTSFTYRAARSGALLSGLAMAIIIETVVLHLWLAPRYPVIAWALTIGGLTMLVWLIDDYRALGHGEIRLTDTMLAVVIGHRATVEVPRALVLSVMRPGWRDVPVSGAPSFAQYVNLLKPTPPNVLMTLTEPVPVRLAGGIRLSAQQFGFCLDHPDAFVAALSRDNLHLQEHLCN